MGRTPTSLTRTDHDRTLDRARYRRDEEKRKALVRATKLRVRYGISLEEYDRMFREQGGVCAICHQPAKNYRLAVDHCHATLKVRGLLCVKCNQRLIALEDSMAGWRQAAEDYLDRTK